MHELKVKFIQGTDVPVQVKLRLIFKGSQSLTPEKSVTYNHHLH